MNILTVEKLHKSFGNKILLMKLHLALTKAIKSVLLV